MVFAKGPSLFVCHNGNSPEQNNVKQPSKQEVQSEKDSTNARRLLAVNNVIMTKRHIRNIFEVDDNLISALVTFSFE